MCQRDSIRAIYKPRIHTAMKSLLSNMAPFRFWQVTGTVKLFTTGFIQVFFVAVNTYFLANTYFIGVFTTSFMISMVWSYNVKKVAFGGTRDRIAYSLGAAFGSVVGLASSYSLLLMFQ